MAMKWCAIAICCLATQALAELRSSPVRTIRSITLDEPAIRSLDPTVACGQLRLDEKRVHFFFQHAKPGHRYDYSRAYELGNCSGGATVRFADGRQVKLRIDDGTGWGTTESKRSASYLYCEACIDLLDPDFDFKEEALQ